MASSPIYPPDSVQAVLGSWWVPEKSPQVTRGRLIWAFVPYVGLTPMTLQATRASATDHETARFELAPLRARDPRKAPAIPVAALHTQPSEVLAVYKAKRRPVLVLSTGGARLPEALEKKLKGWKAPMLIVAPYSGADQGGTRGGWDPEFVRRVRNAEYPQFAYDRLPVDGSATESILRLDQLQPVGRHQDSYELTDWALSADALAIMDEWVNWLLTGSLAKDGALAMMREELPKVAPAESP